MAANIDQPCLVCTYFGINCVQGCRTSTLFRGDDINATYRFYSTHPTNFQFNDATKQMLMESTLRFEATARAKDDAYGVTGLILLLHCYLQKNQYYEFLLKHGVLYGYNSPSPCLIDPLNPTEGLPSFFFDNTSVPRLPTDSAQPQLPPCAACTYFQRSCSLSCAFSPFFQGDTSQDFRDISAREFSRRDVILIHTQRERLTEAQINQLKATTDYFESSIRSFGDQVYGATGILLSIVKHLFNVNRRIDYLLERIAFYRHQLRLSLGVRDPGTIQQSRFDDPPYPATLYYNQVTEPYNLDPALCLAQQRDQTYFRQQLVQKYHGHHDKLESGQHPQPPQYSSEIVVQQPQNPAPTNMNWNEMLNWSISSQQQEQTHRPQLVRQHGQQTQHHQAPTYLTSYPQYQNQGGLPHQQQFQHNQLPHQPVPSSATTVQGQHLQHHPSADQDEIWQQSLQWAEQL